MQIIKSSFHYLVDLVFPAFCQGCAAEGTYLCLACQNAITPPIHRCLVCNKNSPLGQAHTECVNAKTALTGLMVAAEYREPSVRNLVWQLKYNSVRAISQTIALIMADFLAKTDLVDYFAQCLVVPVPAHRKRMRLRGFNQAEEIARHLARNLGFEYCEVLTKLKATKRQVELVREKRLENLKGAFALHPSLNPSPSREGKNWVYNKKIVLIDDVATTCATLNECAKVIRKYNPAEIWGLVVARN